jgi:hypothetical protein
LIFGHWTLGISILGLKSDGGVWAWGVKFDVVLWIGFERRLWNLFLDNEEHLSLLKQLFCQNGSLFIKTKTKGSADIYKKLPHKLAYKTKRR